MNWIDRLPGTELIGIANLDSSDWAKMGLTTSQNVVPTIFIARPSATRKAVVSLFCRENRTVECIVKVALGPSAWPFIERDYDNLQTVQRFYPGLGPRPLGLFPHLGMASQEWIRGEAAHHMPAGIANEFLSRLWQPQCTALTDVAARYRRRFDALPRIAGADTFEPMLDSIRCDSQVPRAFYHGDFAMWNLFRQSNGEWRAFDWEYGDSDSAPLLDLFHFLLCPHIAAGRLNSFQTATRVAFEEQAPAIHSVLDKIGAPFQYAYDALVLSFIALYLTRFNSAFASERLHPQLHDVATTFCAVRPAARASH